MSFEVGIHFILFVFFIQNWLLLYVCTYALQKRYVLCLYIDERDVEYVKSFNMHGELCLPFIMELKYF